MRFSAMKAMLMRFPRLSAAGRNRSVTVTSMIPGIFHRLSSAPHGAMFLSTSKSNDPHKSPWVARKDPEGSGRIYYWNTETNETTPLDAARPAHWVQLPDPEKSGLKYWWNPETNETTPLGAERPAANGILLPVQRFESTSTTPTVNTNKSVLPFGQSSRIQEYKQQQQQMPPPTLGRSMVTFFTWGVGMTMAMVAVRAVLGF